MNPKIKYIAPVAVLAALALWLNSARTLPASSVQAPAATAQTHPSSLPETPSSSATDVPAADPIASARPATPTPATAWQTPARVNGTKLNPDSPAAVTARLQGRPAPARSVLIDASSLLAIDQLQEGQTVRFPLFDGQIAEGKINLITTDAQADNGWLRAGGQLADNAGTFYLAGDGKHVVANVLLPAQGLAYELAPQDDGTTLLSEKPLAELVCFPIAKAPGEIPNLAPAAAVAADAPPLLSSRPSATAVLYIDFDGEVVTDPLWNGGNTIDAAPSALTADQITTVWQRVKEDYAPFDIDVTTDASRYASAPVGKRMRCIVTPTDLWYNNGNSGGVAYLRSFDQAGTGNFSATIPCWVFNTSIDGVAEATSHELGHTFNLAHDGRSTTPVQTYYGGHGTALVSWGPIMGASYGRTLTQWSKGEYALANNLQDDIAIIANAANGFGFIPDEAGNTPTTAAALNAPSGNVNQTGLITTENDSDHFSFTTGGGTVTITATPAPKPNLDILLQLLDASGNLLASSNPDTATNASLSTTVSAGNYFLKIRGTGRGDPLADGYTAYGSVGTYTLTGSIPGASTLPAPVITSPAAATGTVGLAFSYQITASNNPTAYGLTGALPAGLAFNAATGLLSGTPSASGTFPFTLSATNATGTGTASLTLTITQPTGTLTLAQALDGAGLVWTTGGDANWTPQTAITSDGIDAARSGDVANNQSTWVQTTVQGPATVTFRWKVSSEARNDYLRFQVNDRIIRSLSGERDWRSYTYTIAESGTHTLRWFYTKDATASAGADTGWLDTVTITP